MSDANPKNSLTIPSPNGDFRSTFRINFPKQSQNASIARPDMTENEERPKRMKRALEKFIGLALPTPSSGKRAKTDGSTLNSSLETRGLRTICSQVLPNSELKEGNAVIFAG
jgi:hypothetical protein